MSDDSSSSSTAAPPADRVHNDPANATGKDAHGSDPHGSGGDKPQFAHHFNSLSQQFAVEKLGIWLFLATEVLMFGGLFCAYAFYRGLHPEIFLYGHQYLPTSWGAINTVVLLTSSLTMAWAVRAAQLNQRGVLKAMLIATFLGGVGFMVIKGIEYESKFSHDLGPGPDNVFYPIPEGLAADERDKLVAQKREKIAYTEKYYGIGDYYAALVQGESNGGESEQAANEDAGSSNQNAGEAAAEASSTESTGETRQSTTPR